MLGHWIITATDWSHPSLSGSPAVLRPGNDVDRPACRDSTAVTAAHPSVGLDVTHQLRAIEGALRELRRPADAALAQAS